MRIAFYKGEGNIFDRLIRIWTKGKYSHCELVFSDGIFCSSDPRSNGVRYKFIECDETKWDFAEILADIFDENIVRRWCNRKVGKKYDWLGIVLSQILPIGMNDPNRYFCSEFCTDALQQIGKMRGIKPSSESPSTLASMFRLR